MPRLLGKTRITKSEGDMLSREPSTHNIGYLQVFNMLNNKYYP